MPGLKRILFPVDFSEICQDAAGMAVMLGERFHAAIVLLHVVPSFSTSLPLETRDGAASRLESFLTELKTVEVERLILEGEPALTIADYANTSPFDLILMPTHGHGVFRRWVLGSVAEKVLDHAWCPVWTAVHTESMPSAIRHGDTIRSVAAGIDLGEQSLPVLNWAEQFAIAMNARLTIVHAAPEPFNEAQEKIYGLKRNIEAQVDVRPCDGNVVKAVLDGAIEAAADLLVIGRGASGTAGRLHAAASEIIRHSNCVVVSI